MSVKNQIPAGLHKALNGLESWNKAPQTARLSFYRISKGKTASGEELINNWHWFLHGWKAKP